MARERAEEAWAAGCLRAALGVDVTPHDDGSKPGMHDLQIDYPGRAPGAVEVTAAADAAAIELWNLVNDKGRWTVAGIVGGWAVELLPTARANLLKTELPALLEVLEREGVRQVEPERWWEPGPHDEVVRRLGIRHMRRGDTEHEGSVYFTVDQGSDRTGGMVSSSGLPLVNWLGERTARTDQVHNLEKLARSGAGERHLFVILPAFAEAPYEVVDLLMRDGAALPEVDPSLPPEVTHVWAASVWSSGAGMRWSPDEGWLRFDKR
jgi:hypothetical protein